MAAPTGEGTERKTDRLEAFSDAVLAIATRFRSSSCTRPGRKMEIFCRAI